MSLTICLVNAIGTTSTIFRHFLTFFSEFLCCLINISATLSAQPPEITIYQRNSQYILENSVNPDFLDKILYRRYKLSLSSTNSVARTKCSHFQRKTVLFFRNAPINLGNFGLHNVRILTSFL